MATDRFAELSLGGDGGPPPSGSSLCEPEPESQDAAARTDAMQEFNEIKEALTSVEALIAELKEAHRELAGTVFDPASVRAKAEQLNDQIRQAGMQIKGRLKSMDDQLKASKDEDAEAAHTVTHKMRRNMHMTATTKLVLLMGQFQDEQTAFKTTQQQTARRQLKLVKPDATEQELQQVAEGDGQQIFTQIMSSQAHAQQEAVLTEVQAKHDEIVKLEQGIQELHQLITDLALLVETQGEQLDSIEHHIASAKDYIALGVDELRVANEYATSSRKRALQLTALAAGVGLAVLFPVVAPVVGSAQTAGTTGALALLGSGVGVGAAKAGQGSYAAYQQQPEAAGTKKIKVACPISDCACEQRIQVPIATNLSGSSWPCSECGKPFELRQCANCFKHGTAPFVTSGGAAGAAQLESGLLAGDAHAESQQMCQRKGGTCGGAMIGADVIVHA